jgi:Ser/Thr protein kinase RdoA (MazF antagonist)
VRWLDLGEAAQLPERERALVDAWAEDAPLRAPWCRPGWYHGATSWALAQLERAGRRAEGAPEQVRQWDISSIIRIPTVEGDAYLKAVPAYFSHEGDVLRAIGSLAPDELPRVIADDPARHWTLFEEIDGASPPEQDGGHAADALALLARLQIAAIPHAERLLRACPDRRLEHLPAEAAWLLARPGLADSVDAETWKRCTAFARHIERYVGELRACGVPETLVHGDFHLGNVAAEAGRLTLFDWTDACVSHPLFDLATVFYDGHDGPREAALDAYVHAWRAVVPAERLRRALPLADALACIHHAVSYERIAEGMEPGARWQVAGAAQGWLRRLAERAP